MSPPQHIENAPSNYFYFRNYIRCKFTKKKTFTQNPENGKGRMKSHFYAKKYVIKMGILLFVKSEKKMLCFLVH